MHSPILRILTAGTLAAGLLLVPGLAGNNHTLAQGGPSPEARSVIQSLSPEERQKFFALSPEERRAFIQKKLAEKGGTQAQGGPPSGKAGGGKDGFSGKRGGGKGGFSGKRGRGGKGKRGRFRRPPAVELATIGRERLIQTYPITGRMVAANKTEVASTIRGRVAQITVEVGDRVKKGDVLARLDSERFKLEAVLKSADVLQARAKWKSSQAQVVLVQQELKRLERLKKSAAFSQARYDDKRQEVVKALSAVDEAAAALRRARASRDLARVDLKETQIRAPFDGAILIRHTSPGAYINTGNRIVTLLDDRSMEIEADVPSERLAGVKPGSVVNVQLSDNKSIKATVRAIIPDENPLARTQAVRLKPAFGGGDAIAVPNQSVVLMVPLGGVREALAVPKDAIVDRQSGKIVFVFQDGSVRPAQVQVGEAYGNKFEVLSGLRPGQQVVVRGNEALRPNQRVRVTSPRNRGGGANVAARGQGRGGKAGRGGKGHGGKGRGGKGGGGGGFRAIVQSLSPEDRQKFFALSGDERRAFIQKKRAEQAGGAN